MNTNAALKQSIDASEVAYDTVPYESYSHCLTHPDHLWMLGTLFNMTPPPFETARVLELGCGSGGNLIPYAINFPKAKLVGVDLSAEHIKEANDLKDKMGLKNLDFEQCDITKMSKQTHGTFDYIICHGVFSWVPDFVRERILEICRDQLSPDGLALISYNTLPGWNFVRSLRDMMIYHTKNFTNPAEKITQARTLLQFLSENTVDGTGAYKAVLEQELQILNAANDSYIYHDHLEGENKQFYLHEFATMLDQHKLQYVGDVHLNMMNAKNLGEGAFNILKDIADPIRHEQYLDFVTNRRFRVSVVAHADNKIDRRVKADVIDKLYMTANMSPNDPDADPTQEVVFTQKNAGQEFRSDDIRARRFYLELCRQGAFPISASELIDIILEDTGEGEEAREAYKNIALESVVRLALSGFVMLHAAPVEAVNYISDTPEVYPFARLEAQRYPKRYKLTSAIRNMANGDDFIMALVPLVDGTRTVEELERIMLGYVAEGRVVVYNDGIQAANPDRLVPSLVLKALTNLADGTLLVG
jgi:methyltransferase-like protein/2-polyprenyl-3-methyl-5-hydroxy-6-metoxy-1,4-benzoquinol methylase